MDAARRLPIFETTWLTLRWSLAIYLRHWKLPLLYGAALFIIGGVLLGYVGRILTAPPAQPHAATQLVHVLAGQLFWCLYVLALAPLALLTHDEVAHGLSRREGPRPCRASARIAGYALDWITVSAIVLPMVPLAAMASGYLGLGLGLPKGYALIVLATAVVAAALTALGCGCRLLLRLPSRAQGHPLAWREAWRLGRGNALRLLACQLMLILLCAAPRLILAPLDVRLSVPRAAPTILDLAPRIVDWLITAVMLPLSIVITCAFLSVAAARLQGLPDAG